MTNIIRNLTLGLSLSLPSLAIAQGTFLTDPANPSNKALAVAPGGNIGIGGSRDGTPFTSPGALLHTLKHYGDGNIGTAAIFQTQAGGGGSGVKIALLDGRDGELGAFAGVLDALDSAHVTLNVFGSEKVRINSDGKVGFGTPPAANLHIRHGIGAAAQKAEIRIDSTAIGDGSPNSLLLGADGPFFYGTAFIDTMKSGVADVTPLAFRINGGEKMRITADGNVGIGKDNPQAKLDVAGKVSCTVLELTSDRAQKSGFAPVDCGAILAQVARLPLSTWHYTNETSVTHIGPMAQDFQPAFRVGSTNTTIATVDADGVALAAIQGLNQKLEAELESKTARIAALEKEVASLRTDMVARLASLEKQFAQSAPASITPDCLSAASMGLVCGSGNVSFRTPNPRVPLRVAAETSTEAASAR